VRLFIAFGILTLSVASASAQSSLGQQSLSPGLSSGLGSSMESGLQGSVSSDLQARLGDEGTRTLADPFNPYSALQGGGGCAPEQVDPDHRGCRPYAWIRNEGPDPNRIQTYSGDSAFRSGPVQAGPNRIETYGGDSALRF
jgi:hypothetical protein